LSRKRERARIIDHRHCRICGKAIPPDQEFCSEDCRRAHEGFQRRQRRMRNIFLLVYILIFVILLLLLAYHRPTT